MLHRIASYVRSFSSASRPAQRRKTQLMVESLEGREVMSASPVAAYGDVLGAYTEDRVVSNAGVTGGVIMQIPTDITAYYWPQSKAQTDVAMGLPMLDSNPGATATLYLNFTGNFTSDWWYTNGDGSQTHYRNITTPAFSMDSDATKFSAQEQASIREIFARVAEDYAPFNINVTTHYYGAFGDKQALQVAIGGRPADWLGGGSSGIAPIGGFYNADPNLVFVFAGDIVWWANNGGQDFEGRALDIETATATTISHEAGHGFGLRHHAEYDSHGVKTNDYAKGTSEWTPIMGNNLSSDRSIWVYAADDLGVSSMQDDVSILAGAKNGFGFRWDDHGATPAYATTMQSTWSPSILSPTFFAKGIIESPLDRDVFKFTVSATSPVKVQLDPAQYGPNLRAKLELMQGTTVIATAAPATTATQRSIITNLGPGTYYIRVSTYGSSELGQYSVGVYFSWSTGTVGMASKTTATTTTSTAKYSAPLAMGGSSFLPMAMDEAPPKKIDFEQLHSAMKIGTLAELEPLALAMAERMERQSKLNSDDAWILALDGWTMPLQTRRMR